MSKWRHLPVKAAAEIFALQQKGTISASVGKDLIDLTIVRNMLLEATDGPKSYEYMLERHQSLLVWFLEQVLSLPYVGAEHRRAMGLDLVKGKLG